MLPEIIDIKGDSKLISVIGADTFLGYYLTQFLYKKGMTVFAFSEKRKFTFSTFPMAVYGRDNTAFLPVPVISDSIIVCIRPEIGFISYIEKIKQICDHLIRKQYCGKVFLLSSGAICYSFGAPISEDANVFPRTERDMTLAAGENLLNIMRYQEKCMVTPYVIRLGTIYGNKMDECNESDSGFIDKLVYNAIKRQRVINPVPGDALRTVTHISDVCESITRLMSMEFLPDIINIPGENLSLSDISGKIAKRFNAKLSNFSPKANDPDFFIGDQYLSDELFKTQCDYIRKIDFDEWLNCNDQDVFLKKPSCKKEFHYA